MLHHPATRRPIEVLKRSLQRFVLPKGQAWVRVRSGLSEGMAMRLRFPEEAGVWLGEHEPEVQDAITAVVRAGSVVFDIGAAIGTFALGTARLVGKTGRVVAFDGDPIQAARLREHTAANKLGDVLHVIPAAVWSNTPAPQVPFRCGKTMRSQGGVEVDGIRPILASGELIAADVTSLDAFVSSTGVAPHLIKVDVEGGEMEVLRGGATLFITRRPLIIAEIHTEEARDGVRAWMREYAYSAFEIALYDPAPIRLFAWPKEQEPGPWVQTVARMRVSSSAAAERMRRIGAFS